MKAQKITPVKGGRDFYPADSAFQNWLFEKMRAVSHLFGFEEYDGPILEPLALYEAKSGEELVKKQTYAFDDRSGRKVAIRPEMTPTLARMVAAKQNQLVKPVRWFSIGNFWRYEAPQKGRTRDFWQWNADILGPATPEADAEIIALGCEFFKTIGLPPAEVVIKINDRNLLQTRLDIVGVTSGQLQTVFKIIDKKAKVTAAEFENLLRRAGLDKKQIENLKSTLEDFDYARESDNLTTIFSTLEDLGYSDYCLFDPTIVRGLDYYTGTVFEAFDREGRFRATLAGGRYDNLIAELGGQELPGVGFGAGDLVIKLVLQNYGKVPDFPPTPTKVLVTVFDQSFVRESLKLANQLRQAQIPAEFYCEVAKLDKQLKYANLKNIPYVIIIGPEESTKGQVTLKDMSTGEQKMLTKVEAIAMVKSN